MATTAEAGRGPLGADELARLDARWRAARLQA